jgi:hypothetical protein
MPIFTIQPKPLSSYSLIKVKAQQVIKGSIALVKGEDHSVLPHVSEEIDAILLRWQE